jgi:hypothetical protein
MSILPCLAGGCELVLGDLPTPKEDLTTASGTSSTASTGAGGHSGSSSSGPSSSSSGSGTGSSNSGTGGTTTSESTGGGGSTTTTSGEGGCCDCDGDNQLAEGLCGGNDCDDANKQIYEGEPVYHIDKTPAGSFDWDCSGAAERDPAMDIVISCSVLPCKGTGFLNVAPACGEKADWVECTGSLVCQASPVEHDKVMACK